MPERYKAIRDRCIKKGGKTKACKRSAARIENSLRKKAKQKPMQPHRKKPRRSGASR